MKIIKVQPVLVGFLILVCLSSSGISQGYRGITPLRSTCADVERLFSVPACGKSNSVIKLKEETVQIDYSQIECDAKWSQRWNVPVGTVLSIERNLNTFVPLIEFQPDLTKFKRGAELHNEVIYNNETEGIILFVVNGSVRAVFYAPSSSDRNLGCPEPKNCVPGTGTATVPAVR